MAALQIFSCIIVMSNLHEREFQGVLNREVLRQPQNGSAIFFCKSGKGVKDR